jgi:hypothetical protein
MPSTHWVTRKQGVIVKIEITRDGKNYTGVQKQLGWKMHWVDENACGVSPMLAFRECLYVLSETDRWANQSKEEFEKVHEAVKKMYGGQGLFTVVLASFPHRPTIEVQALLDGTDPPTTIHTIFTSVRESVDATHKVIFQTSSDSLRRVIRGQLKGEKDKDGFVELKLGEVNHVYDSPVAMAHPMKIGIRANVQLQDDGTVKLLDGPVTYNVIS